MLAGGVPKPTQMSLPFYRNRAGTTMEPYRNRVPFTRNRLFDPFQNFAFIAFGRLMNPDQVTPL